MPHLNLRRSDTCLARKFPQHIDCESRAKYKHTQGLTSKILEFELHIIGEPPFSPRFQSHGAGALEDNYSPTLSSNTIETHHHHHASNLINSENRFYDAHAEDSNSEQAIASRDCLVGKREPTKPSAELFYCAFDSPPRSESFSFMGRSSGKVVLPRSTVAR